jgi:hypothetical protein
MLTFRSGGWVLLLAGLIAVGIVTAWLVIRVPQFARLTGVGDTVNVESYGFDLSNLAAPRELLVAGGFKKDGLPRLVEPQFLTSDQLPALREALRSQHVGKPVAGEELVIGVVIDGVARAYPTRILALHEVFNDTLAGTPIVVTYNGLCDSSAVFERAVAGAVRDFGVSGLLLNSNLLMYDRQAEPADESLWSQLGMAAVSGPLAGTTLTPLPIQVVPWKVWLDRHPDSDVLLPPTSQFRRYKKVSYGVYYSVGKVQFPIAETPDAAALKPMAKVVALQTGGAWQAVAIAALTAHGAWELPGAQEVSLVAESVPETAWQDAKPPILPTVYARWFAWNAFQPQAPLITPTIAE